MRRKAMVLTRPEDHEDKISIDFYFDSKVDDAFNLEDLSPGNMRKKTHLQCKKTRNSTLLWRFSKQSSRVYFLLIKTVMRKTTSDIAF